MASPAWFSAVHHGPGLRHHLNTETSRISTRIPQASGVSPLLFPFIHDQLSALLKDSRTAPSRVCSRTKTGNNAPYFRDRVIQSMSKRTATRVPSRARMTRAGDSDTSSPVSEELYPERDLMCDGGDGRQHVKCGGSSAASSRRFTVAGTHEDEERKKPRSDGAYTTLLGPPITSPEPPITSPEPPITSPDPPITSSEPPITSPELPITSPGPPITSPSPPITSPEPPITSAEPPITSAEPPITSAEPPITSPSPPITSAEPPIISAEPPIISAEPPITSAGLSTVNLGISIPPWM
ncbi:uncharacterized protein LOC128319146 [Pangasianodon hypophthalmus]|uniref:uncharacterized protein LOC128319146 n=1 Tax=Pangasianodon hypophthalmus TaxID=310915 RepID=UPI00230720BF|nr:uncharacterized protein LOC128319146 [Pangasianodon hypophthalmus]